MLTSCGDGFATDRVVVRVDTIITTVDKIYVSRKDFTVFVRSTHGKVS